MKNHILLKTNLLVCLVIVAGFLLTAVLSYRANYAASLKNIEQVSILSSEGIYEQVSGTFTKPVNISLTMANDSLLKELLGQERERLDDPAFIAALRDYLAAYQEQFGYDSVFLVSHATRRYYNFNGLDRVLSPREPEDQWYYGRLDDPEDCYLVVDNDQVAGAANEITVFVNCRIWDGRGTLLGAVGVGLRVEHFQALLRSYQDQYGTSAYLVSGDGDIEVSADYTGYEQVSLLQTGRFSQDAMDSILDWDGSDSADGFWSAGPQGGGMNHYVVVRYLPELNWRLVVSRDTGELVASLTRQLAVTVVIICLIITIILVVIACVIRSFNRRIVYLTQITERERHTVFEQVTEQIFENIYEMDITHNCPANRVTEEYFERLGAPAGTPYSQALAIVAEKEIKEEFRQGYLDTFSPENVQRVFDQGQDSLQYDFMLSTDGEHYYWMRIMARIVRLEGDGSLHMLVYRQNIDADKRQELRMQELAQTDEMTGLLNKAATQRAIDRILAEAGDQTYALFLLDIDHFKQANDLHGHAFGDKVIVAFTSALRAMFRTGDLLGRIGGDEFIALIPVPDGDWTAEKARELRQALNQVHTYDGMSWHATASIGVALFPRDGTDRESLFRSADVALYQAKAQGKDSFAVYCP